MLVFSANLLVAAADLGLTADVGVLLRIVLIVARGGDDSGGESQSNGSDGELHFDGGKKGCLKRTHKVYRILDKWYVQKIACLELLLVDARKRSRIGGWSRGFI